MGPSRLRRSRCGGDDVLSTPDVIAVTYRGDIAADLVVLEASRRGASLFRFNTEDYPAAVGITIDPCDPAAATLSTREGEIAIGAARGIWIRRPRWPVLSADITEAGDQRLAQVEAVAALGGTWRVLADRCVSPPDAMQAARWKVAQLAVASELGFRVPATLVTSDPAAAVRFVSAGRTVLKAVAEGRTRGPEGERVGGTVEIDGSADLAAVRLAPVLMQRRVDKAADLRVTVVGRRVFAVRIVTPPGAPLDFRLTSPAECRFEAVEVPHLERGLLAFLDRYGLRYGAFDLAEDKVGDPWFLECNPAGQWGWLEPPTRLDITGALVDLLLAPRGVTR